MKKTSYKFLLICFFLCARLGSLYAQEAGSISGKLLDNKGEPMIGALVQDDETKQGAQTDFDGNFKIANVKEGEHTITIKSLGFTTVKKKVSVKAGENAVVETFKMAEATKQLNEVVVVGYGTATKRTVTGAISKVSGKDLENVPVPSFDAAIQGRASGVQVVQSSGVAGGAVRVRVRGQSSLSGNGDPLYVIDGVPITNGDFSSKGGATGAAGLNPLASINPDDIESMEVLKDAAAGAIYGARAANGVILVTTKRGKSGKTQFNFSASTGISTPTKKIEMLNGEQWAELYMEAFLRDSIEALSIKDVKGNPIKPKKFTDNFNGIPVTRASFLKRQFADGTPFANTNWFDEVLQVGKTQDYNLSAKGGNEKTTYYLAGGYNKTNSMLKGNAFQRISGRINVDNQATEKLKLGTSVGTYYTSNDQVPTSYNGGIGSAQSNALPIFPVYNSDGSYFGTQIKVPTTGSNPAAQLQSKYNTSTFRSLTNLYAEYKIIPDLTLRTEGALDYMDMFETFYYSPVNRYFLNKPLGAISERRVNVVNFNNNNTLNYTKTFKEKHKVTALAGFALQGSTQKDVGFYPASDAVGFTDPYFTTSTSNMDFAAGATADQKKGPKVGGYNSRDFYRFASYFTRVNYVFMDKYIGQVSLRSDGSSRFGANRRFGYFPAVSAAWVASEEEFLRKYEWISLVKLRTSFGITGNSEIGNFAWLGSYGTSGGYLGTTGIAPTRLANPDLSWESNKQFDIGLDFGVLNDRITGSVGYYYKVASDVLLKRPVQISATGIKEIFVNSGVLIQNQGWEFSLTSRNFIKKFKWTTDFNISANRNVVLESDGIPVDFDAGPGDARILEGKSVGTAFLARYAGVNPQTGYEQVYDLSGNKIDLTQDLLTTPVTVQQDNRVAMGKPFPDFIGGITNSFSFMNFELSAMFVFSYGNTVYDDGAKYQYGSRIGTTWNQRAEVLDRWQKPGDVTDIPKLLITPFNPDNANTSKYLYDASYLRLRTLQIAYNLPKNIVEKAKLQSLKVFVMGQNLWLLTKYPGWDPEVTRSVDDSDGNVRNNQGNVAFAAPYLSTPQARTITFGLNLGF